MSAGAGAGPEHLQESAGGSGKETDGNHSLQPLQLRRLQFGPEDKLLGSDPVPGYIRGHFQLAPLSAFSKNVYSTFLSFKQLANVA